MIHSKEKEEKGEVITIVLIIIKIIEEVILDKEGIQVVMIDIIIR